MQMLLQTGDLAPHFEISNQDGKVVTLNDFGDQNIVLYFYPKDDTPGCTIEANDFTQLASEFSAANTAIIGVSKDSCESHQAFIDKFGLKIDLLSDTTGELCEAYCVWQEKEKNGQKSMGIVRSTFIIHGGNIIDAFYGVNPEGHAAAMLEKVKTL